MSIIISIWLAITACPPGPGARAGHGHELAGGSVVRVLVDVPVPPVGAELADAVRVAVGCRVRELAQGVGPGRAGDIVDDDLLAQSLPHALADDGGRDVGRPAGR